MNTGLKHLHIYIALGIYRHLDVTVVFAVVINNSKYAIFTIPSPGKFDFLS